MDETHVVVTGTSRVLETSDGEFGGTGGTWCVPKQKLLNKNQRRAIRWKRRLMGDRAADAEYHKVCATVIAEHSNSLSAR